MDAKQLIEEALKVNPEVCLVLEVAARARGLEEREPIREFRAEPSIGANPTAAQGAIPSGCVLKYDRYLIP